MRKRIIDWFFTLQSQRGILGEKERRFYTYAYGLLLNKIATAEEMKTMAELYNISQMFNYSKIFDLPNIYIDNTKLDGFLKKFVDDYACNHKICVSKQNIDVTDSNYCSYCSSWVQRAIIYNGEQVEKWIDNCREFEKALDRSEVFRSVL